jgi:hypothetical protein
MRPPPLSIQNSVLVVRNRMAAAATYGTQVRYNPNSFLPTFVVAVELIQRQQQGSDAV